ncbi:MAG: DUF2911 domain-containing protein [Acidobacteriaceae bacterium]
MRQSFVSATLAVMLVAASVALAEEPKAEPAESVTSCDLDNGNQIAIRYLPVKAKGSREGFGNSVRYGTVWAPQNQAMVMFTSGSMSVENKDIPAGAYTLFVIPEKDQWTLVISKETDTKAKYDQAKDAARVPMEVGSLPTDHPQFSVILGHTGPDKCSLRVYWQDKGAFATLEGK